MSVSYAEKYLSFMRHNDKLQCMKRPAPALQFAPTDLRLLKVFQAVVRHEGFASAQSELGISPGTISNHIAQLEGRLGVRLCERGRKGFSLTSEGLRIHEAAESLLRSADNFAGTVGSIRGELTGTIHFGTVDAMYTNRDLHLDHALARFSALAPKVGLHLEIASPQDLQQRLLDGRFGLILTPLDEAHPSIRAMALFREEQSLYCGEGHPLFAVADDGLDRGRLQEFPYAARTYMKESAGPTGLAFQSKALASHMESLAILILSGRYLGFLPTHFASSFVQQGRMRSLLFESVSYHDTFFLAHRSDERSRPMKLLWDCIAESLMR
jgi:LysR family transcriptional regulator, transcriptional activator for bauABCD operon